MDIKKQFRESLGFRRPNSHKGDYGRVFILAGSLGMSGACLLSSQAALRSGAGLVSVGVPKCLALPLAKRITEAMLKPLPENQKGALGLRAYSSIQKFLFRQDVLAIGPGLSQEKETQRVIRKVISNCSKTVIIDADGLNAMVGHLDLLNQAKVAKILTPHPGEFRRLFGISVPNNDSLRKALAQKIAKKFKVILVLKGHHSVVASPGGEIYLNKTGNPGMATAGAGDVLTGIIAAFSALKNVKPFQAACLGVYVHGLAGDLAAKEVGQISLIAGDIIQYLPRAFKKLGIS